jgi:hypothetical protein
MSEENDYTGPAGIIERTFKNNYFSRALDHLIAYRELDYEYSEGEFAKCTRIPQEKMSEVVSLLKRYKFAEVTGESPNSVLRWNKESEHSKMLEKLAFYLACTDMDRSSIEKGYEDSGSLV